jgi:hypothetical protein
MTTLGAACIIIGGVSGVLKNSGQAILKRLRQDAFTDLVTMAVQTAPPAPRKSAIRTAIMRRYLVSRTLGLVDQCSTNRRKLSSNPSCAGTAGGPHPFCALYTIADRSGALFCRCRGDSGLDKIVGKISATGPDPMSQSAHGEHDPTG